MTTSFLRINNPLTIAGFSNRSSVVAHLSKSKDLSHITSDAGDLTKKSNIGKHFLIPEVDLKATWILDSLLLARDRLGIVDIRFNVDATLVAKLINIELQKRGSLGLDEVKILTSWSMQWNQEINTPPIDEATWAVEILPFEGVVGKLGNFFLVDARQLGIENVLDALEYLDSVEKVFPLLEMAHIELTDRTKAYEGQLIELRAKFHN